MAAATATEAPIATAPAAWADALHAAALIAVDPVGLGGARVQAGAGPVRDRWLAALHALLPPGTPWRRLPLHIGDERLLGGLDLTATLQAGRPVAQRGLLAEADGGVLLLPMAERLPPATAARLAQVLDLRVVATERDGLALRAPSRLALVALDEGVAEPGGGGDEPVPGALIDRLAFSLDLRAIGWRDTGAFAVDLGTAPTLLEAGAADVLGARERLGRVQIDDAVIEALCAAAQALGVASLRAPLFALRAACAAAALDGREMVDTEDVTLAARLVLAPRATQWPRGPADESPAADQTPPEPPHPPEIPPEPPPSPPPVDDTTATPEPDRADPPPAPTEPAAPLEDVVLAAARAAIPAGLLAQLAIEAAAGGRSRQGRGAGALRQSHRRGRPTGVRRGEPQGGARLNVIETLRAAAPWQKLRRAAATRPPASGPARIEVRAEDFHVTRYRERSETTAIFLIDASGSAALHRLAEAKGAIELLLADCYVRRDRVAVLAFRGAGAELLLPPTRSLVRAKRSLAGLPGGGGTPLAAGLDAAQALAETTRRRGDTPLLVLLTDGRANIARDGRPGRAQAMADALQAGRRWRGAQAASLLVDTSPQPQAAARQLAEAMGAVYLPLPQAGAATLSRAVQALARAQDG